MPARALEIIMCVCDCNAFVVDIRPACRLISIYLYIFLIHLLFLSLLEYFYLLSLSIVISLIFPSNLVHIFCSSQYLCSRCVYLFTLRIYPIETTTKCHQYWGSLLNSLSCLWLGLLIHIVVTAVVVVVFFFAASVAIKNLRTS